MPLKVTLRIMPLVYGRKPVFPEDLLLDTVPNDKLDGNLPSNYVSDMKLKLRIITENVLSQLKVNATHMRINYNKGLVFRDYMPGEKVWLSSKFYKTGESAKCAPRRDGPWTIIEKLNNGVNFRIRNDKSSALKIVHHDRLKPVFIDDKAVKCNPQPVNPNRSTMDDIMLSEESESEPDEECPNNTASSSESENEQPDIPRRYPLRNRTASRYPGVIPWDTLEDI